MRTDAIEQFKKEVRESILCSLASRDTYGQEYITHIKMALSGVRWGYFYDHYVYDAIGGVTNQYGCFTVTRDILKSKPGTCLTKEDHALVSISKFYPNIEFTMVELVSRPTHSPKDAIVRGSDWIKPR